jgi:hypothetical protein
MFEYMQWLYKHRKKFRAAAFIFLLVHSFNLAAAVYADVFEWFDLTFWGFVLGLVAWVATEINFGDDEDESI